MVKEIGFRALVKKKKKEKKSLKGLSINQHFIDFKLTGGLLSVPGVQYVHVCL